MESKVHPKKWLTGIIVQKSRHLRSYVVQMEDKTMPRRNEQHIRPREERVRSPENFYQSRESRRTSRATERAANIQSSSRVKKVGENDKKAKSFR